MKARKRSVINKNNILNLILAFVLVASVIFYFFSQKNKDKAKESVQYNLASKETSSSEERAKKAELIRKYSEEVTFDNPIDVVWEGKIIATFVSGSDYGIKKIPEDKDFPYFYAWINSDAFPEHVAMDGVVEVTGKWTGITCAYQNTVFERCVPDVEVKEIRVAEPIENVQEFDWSQPYAFFVSKFSNDDYPDVYQEIFTGGAHCCFRYKAFIQTGDKSIIEVPLDEQDYVLWPKDINNDGVSELVGNDSTFNYWNASYADSQAPEIILSFNPKKRSFDLNISLMKKPAPSKEDLGKEIEKNKNDKELNNRGNVESFPSPLWGYMLDLIYSGNEKSAWEFFDLAWPENVTGKEDFKVEFQKQLEKSPYIEEIRKLNSGENQVKKTSNAKEEFKIISFKNGQNSIDLNSDGIRDTVFKSFRNNGVSPHSSDVYSFYIFKPKSEYNIYDLWTIAQIFENPDDIEEKNDIETVVGADCILRDIRIAKTSDKKTYLIVADRDRKLSYADDEPVGFEIYKLKENDESIPGWPDYYFEKSNSIKAKNEYCDVNEAMDKELVDVLNQQNF